MTTEEKYKEALEKAKKLYEKGTITESLGYIFPELKESEDEIIRKGIIKYLSWIKDRDGSYMPNNIPFDDMIAWLEKQGETFTKKDIDDAYLKGVSDAKHELEKQGEQKPADNGEPKFKVGEWITHNTANFVFKIINVGSNGYEVVNRENYKKTISFDNEDNYHLWTIQDAKDGDVLISELSNSIILFKGIEDNNIQFYCDYDFSEIGVPEDRFAVNNSGQHYGNIEESEDFHPATKEQCDTLFAKMHEAGYMWDSESKQLLFLKAEPRYTQNPAWSEEDSMMIEETLYFLREYQQSNRCKDENGMQNSVTCEKWLKSLKQRITE